MGAKIGENLKEKKAVTMINSTESSINGELRILQSESLRWTLPEEIHSQVAVGELIEVVKKLMRSGEVKTSFQGV